MNISISNNLTYPLITEQIISPQCFEWCQDNIPEKCYNINPVFISGVIIIIFSISIDNRMIKYPIFLIGLIVIFIGFFV